MSSETRKPGSIGFREDLGRLGRIAGLPQLPLIGIHDLDQGLPVRPQPIRRRRRRSRQHPDVEDPDHEHHGEADGRSPVAPVVAEPMPAIRDRARQEDQQHGCARPHQQTALGRVPRQHLVFDHQRPQRPAGRAHGFEEEQAVAAGELVAERDDPVVLRRRPRGELLQPAAVDLAGHRRHHALVAPVGLDRMRDVLSLPRDEEAVSTPAQVQPAQALVDLIEREVDEHGAGRAIFVARHRLVVEGDDVLGHHALARRAEVGRVPLLVLIARPLVPDAPRLSPLFALEVWIRVVVGDRRESLLPAGAGEVGTPERRLPLAHGPFVAGAHTPEARVLPQVVEQPPRDRRPVEPADSDVVRDRRGDLHDLLELRIDHSGSARGMA